MRLSKEQIAAARGLLSLSQTDLANATGVKRVTLSRFEGGLQADMHKTTFDKLFTFFENRGVVFSENHGVAFRPAQEIIDLHGQDGFRVLMDTVYETANSVGGNISIINGSPALFLQHLGKDWYSKHAERMFALRDHYNFRIIAERQGHEIAQGFAEYRWINKNEFHNQSVYIFGNKVAFINFSDADVDIELVQRRNMAVTFNVIFDHMWKSLENSRDV